MPKVESADHMAGEQLDYSEGEAWFTSFDLNYAYGQIEMFQKNGREFQLLNYWQRGDCTVPVHNSFSWVDSYDNSSLKDKALRLRWLTIPVLSLATYQLAQRVRQLSCEWRSIGQEKVGKLRSKNDMVTLLKCKFT